MITLAKSVVSVAETWRYTTSMDTTGISNTDLIQKMVSRFARNTTKISTNNTDKTITRKSNSMNMLIRTEGCTECSQGQRIAGEKI